MKPVRPVTVTIFVFAILAGLVAAFVVRRSMRPGAAAVKPTKTIVVPRINLPKYARIRDQDVEAREVPSDQVPEGAVTTLARAYYRLVKETVLAGEPILEEDLYQVGETPTLSEQVPPGYRAVTIRVTRGDALDGLVMPESLVDVSLTVEGDHPQLGGVATVTLLRRVKVLATDQQRWRFQERNGGIRAITVAVTPEQANKLILAQRYGSLSVTLRGESNEELADVIEPAPGADLVNPAALLGLPEVEPPAAEIVQKAQIWRGGEMQEVTFRMQEIREAEETTARLKSPKPGVAVVPASAGEKSARARAGVRWQVVKTDENAPDSAAPAAVN